MDIYKSKYYFFSTVNKKKEVIKFDNFLLVEITLL